MISQFVISKFQPRKQNLNNLMPTTIMFESKGILNPTQCMSTPIVIVRVYPSSWDFVYDFVFGPCAGDFAFGQCSGLFGEGETEEGEGWGCLLGHCDCGLWEWQGLPVVESASRESIQTKRRSGKFECLGGCMRLSSIYQKLISRPSLGDKENKAQ